MRRWFWVLDALVVIAFVVIGREDHGLGTSVSDTIRVAAPFLFALAIAIAVLRAWRSGGSPWTGLAIALITVAIGMLLRRLAWDDGTAPVFIVVTTAFLVVGMVGWRLVAYGVARLAASRGSATT